MKAQTHFIKNLSKANNSLRAKINVLQTELSKINSMSTDTDDRSELRNTGLIGSSKEDDEF